MTNLRSNQSGELDVAIAQADWQYHLHRGTSKRGDVGANEELQFLFSAHIDTAHLVARADARASSFGDLEGKIVNIRDAGSGTNAR